MSSPTREVGLNRLRRVPLAVTLAAFGAFTLSACGGGQEDTGQGLNSTPAASAKPNTNNPSTSADPNAPSQEKALAALAKMESSYDELHDNPLTNPAGLEYEYGNLPVAEKLIIDPSFRREFGICDNELNANKWANSEFLKLNANLGDFIQSEQKAGNLTPYMIELMRFRVDRAKMGNVVINYLLAEGDSANASCLPEGEDFKVKKSYSVEVNGKEYTVKNNSFLGVIRPPIYVSVNEDRASVSADGILAAKFDDGKQACTMDDYYVATEGLPPSAQFEDLEGMAKAAPVTGVKDSGTQYDGLQQLQIDWLREQALGKLGNVC